MSVVISPATTTRPVVISVSQATRACGSPARTASRTESEIWSAILSGWPSVTDSDVKENERLMPRRLADAQEGREGRLLRRVRAVGEERTELRQARRHVHARECEQRQRGLDVGVHEARRLARHPGVLRRREECRIGG